MPHTPLGHRTVPRPKAPLWLAVSFVLAGLAGFLRAETVAGLPAPTGYVDDFAGVLTPQTRQSLEALCTQVDRQAHAQIAVVTIKTISPDKSGATPSIEEFATALEDKWKVGTKGTDRGVLMIFVMSPIRGRIEVGYGLEGVLNDAKVGDIGREMAPYAQRGDYNDAIPLGVREIAQDIASDAGVALSAAPVIHTYHRQAQPQTQISIFQVLLFGGIALAVIVVLVRTGHIGMLFFLLMNLMGGGGGGGGGRDDEGGGGFGGFGGGSSGGGGASGDF